MFTTLIDKVKSDLLISKFKNMFVVSDYNKNNQRKSKLLWCNLSCKGKIVSIDEFAEIPIDICSKVYFYNERDDKMYQIKFLQVVQYIQELEPWEDIDCEIFDDTMTWFISITHEDFCIVYGL